MNSVIRKILVIIIQISIIYIGYGETMASSYNSDHSYTKVKIYYYGWNILTRSKLTTDFIRNNSKITITIFDKNEIYRLLSFLKLDTMEKVENAKEEDPRLVIDLFNTKNEVITYYSSDFNLLSSDSLKKRKIDDNFKKKFHF